jgi:hypothetical protein
MHALSNGTKHKSTVLKQYLHAKVVRSLLLLLCRSEVAEPFYAAVCYTILHTILLAHWADSNRVPLQML